MEKQQFESVVQKKKGKTNLVKSRHKYNNKQSSLEQRRALSIEFCHFSPKFSTRFDPVSAEPSKQVLWRHRSASQTFGTLKLRRNGRLLICWSTVTLNILSSVTLKILVDCDIKQTYIEIWTVLRKH